MVEVRLRGKPASPGVGVAPSILIVHRLPGEAVVEDPLKAFREAVAEEGKWIGGVVEKLWAEGREDDCLLYTSPSPRDLSTSRMPSSA